MSSPNDNAAPPDAIGLNFARRSNDPLGAQALGFLGVGGFFLAWWISLRWAVQKPPAQLILFVLLTAAPMAILSVLVNRVHLRPDSGLAPVARPFDPRRCAIKLLGLLLTLSTLALAYWLFPLYARDFYQPVWEAARLVFWPALLLMAAYFFWIDRRMAQPKDGYWHMGLLLTHFLLLPLELIRNRADSPGRNRRTVHDGQIDWQEIRGHVAGWIIKGFYLPLMLAGAVPLLEKLISNGVDFKTFGGLYTTSLNLIFALDVVFGAAGYLFTLRLLDTQIRSSESTGLGWASAICCYEPFASFMYSAFLSYKGPVRWNDWLQEQPMTYISWGFAILLLHVIYVWATVSFGCRFSNLTNRGILVDGPYRFVRHPAYVAKNLAWWMMSVPFVAHAAWDDALRACLCLALTNGIYVLRAKTEERHLSRDPAYVAYCRWIDRHGLLAQIRALFRRRS
ncbi:MAG: isoprenylcysteine carboxylmethyltransferase family protein [Verrucomicrobiae bacterium]|nr:isoprenylcysteine carboxylmethyltransferase family protein [Verrucomicrobiae bacterium]